jgi:hypothetical protein
MAEALAQQQRREHDGHDRLSYEHDRRDLDRRARLKCAGLAEHPHGRCGGSRQPPCGRDQEMVAREVIGCELRRHATPAERQSGADHRHDRARAPKRAQQVREHARQGECHEHDRDRQRLARVMRVARRGSQGSAEHAEHDRRHRDVLVAPGVLPEHALSDHQQHQQARGERGLHDHQRRQQQRDDLQRPAEDREACAEQPTGAPDQSRDQRDAQVLLVGSLPGIQRLQGDP